MSCERSFHVALWHVAATQASLPSQWRRTCNTLMKIPMNCQPQGPRCGRPWLAASNCVQVLIICPMTGRTGGRADGRADGHRWKVQAALQLSFCFHFSAALRKRNYRFWLFARATKRRAEWVWPCRTKELGGASRCRG